MKIPPIYPITDKVLADRPTHLSILRELIRGGATWVQIRDKHTPARELLYDLLRCIELAERNKVVVIVNDRCDLALSARAAGVHVGRDDLPPRAARELLGRRAIIGHSTHSLHQIKSGNILPVDYLAFGPIFPTMTKGGAGRAVGLENLKRACRQSRKPIVAIGGIGHGDVGRVLDRGAASVALISALMSAKDLARGMEALLKIARERE